MFNFLFGQAKTPQRVATDQVVPEKGELEHHIPATFSQDRPAVGFDHFDLSDVAVEDHSTAKRIPRPPRDGRPAIVGDPDDLSELTYGHDAPKTLDDYLYTDRPELGLRVISFKNATIVVLHWIHLAFGAVAKRSLLDAWTLMLQGREDEILQPLAPNNYVLENIGRNPTEPHALATHRISVPGIVSWVLRNVYSLALSSKEHRMLCVPAAYLAKLRTKALAELAAQAFATGQKATPFLSEGDVLVAWTTRLAMTNLSQDSERCVGVCLPRPPTLDITFLTVHVCFKVAVQQAYQWRPVLADLIPANKPFLSNCVGFLVTLVTAKDVLQKPLSYLASQIRRTIEDQGTRKQVEAYTSLIRQDSVTKAPPFFGDSSMQLIMFSNWQKANMYDTDLSAAAFRSRETPLFPSYVQTVQAPYCFTDGIIIVGKDKEGNYWLSGYRVKGLWDVMEEKIAQNKV
ncbi:hypothetical protein CCHL11_05646 [Colletotrichum chlorophyti]|uniref:Uncharacterized protein n=1 Tax=Colletotrichum chlorophyti TaxID=708187 RepID=A0A1Q8RTN1_9PEZI|nr:hypothetical protein CCHL11_05646 [Colletotrichum chlorophyti]